MKEIIKNILSQIEQADKSSENIGKLPCNSYYLDENHIVCCKRDAGVSRYPYCNDGLTMWIYQNGHISVNEGEYTIFRPSYTDESPCIGFFLGLENEDGTFTPISVNDANSQLLEPDSVRRYTIYTTGAAYFIATTDDFTFATRAFIGDDKRIYFTNLVINNSNETKNTYIASYFLPLQQFAECDTQHAWAALGRKGIMLENGNFVTYHYAKGGLATNIKTEGNVTKRYSSVARPDFIGSAGRIYSNAESLKTGKFKKTTNVAIYRVLPNVGDITHYTLAPNESGSITFCLSNFYNIEDANKVASDNSILNVNLEDMVRKIEERTLKTLSNLEINFNDWNIGKNSTNALNNFIKTVQNQVSFCAFGKNYAGLLLGVRDVFQQLEAALMWDRESARRCIVRAFNFIDASGRPPRQFGVPPFEKTSTTMDPCPYIDQGIWMIDTIYTYLCYTKDYTILDEICTYYHIPLSRRTTTCEFNDELEDSLLEHLFRITNYLSANIDREFDTNCLRVLFGDWNDALDGLGDTDDEGKEYGSGVSVMATLQFYRNLHRMIEILEHIGGYEEKISEYTALCNQIKEGFFKYAVHTNDSGEKRIVHGWGDKLSYYVGSFKDSDGENRISFASNAFYALSGMIYADDSLKTTAIGALKSLDSKYGLKTLYPPFTPDSTGVGRIRNTIIGTSENACAYVHASMFSLAALFAMGESEYAWRQLEKSIVISHDNPSLSTFAMPNSYLENKEANLDGESAGDWYTGSGTMLIKTLVKYGFGIQPTLDGLTIELPAFMPATDAKISFKIGECNISLHYQNKNNGKRQYFINDKSQDTQTNPVTNNVYIKLSDTDLSGNLSINIVD